MSNSKLQQIVQFQPAWDKRHKDPNKNYGIHSVQCFMVLKGEKGAVSFSFSTGMLLDSTMQEYIPQGRAAPSVEFGYTSYLNKPMGYDLSVHSLKQENKDVYHKKECIWLDNKPCYLLSTSGMAAEPMLNVLIEKGSDEIWKQLEELYNKYFNETNT